MNNPKKAEKISANRSGDVPFSWKTFEKGARMQYGMERLYF